MTQSRTQIWTVLEVTPTGHAVVGHHLSREDAIEQARDRARSTGRTFQAQDLDPEMGGYAHWVKADDHEWWISEGYIRL